MPGLNKAHAVEILAEFLPAIGLDLNILGKLHFRLPMLASGDVVGALSGALLVFPESRRNEKEWPYFGDFLEAVAISHPKRQFAWCGSDRLTGSCPDLPNVRNLSGQTSLLDIVALIQSATGIIANDSGPIHIAAAVGTPVLGLFAPTSPELYGPYPLTEPTHMTLRAEDHTMVSLRLEKVSQSSHRI